MTMVVTNGTPFMPVVPNAGGDGSRNAVDVIDTEGVIKDFTSGKSPAVTNGGGQVTSTNSPEYKNLSPAEKEKMNIIAAQIRSY